MDSSDLTQDQYPFAIPKRLAYLGRIRLQKILDTQRLRTIRELDERAEREAFEQRKQEELMQLNRNTYRKYDECYWTIMQDYLRQRQEL
jgi:hypothetical protein